jgi:hypothetical protein
MDSWQFTTSSMQVSLPMRIELSTVFDPVAYDDQFIHPARLTETSDEYSAIRVKRHAGMPRTRGFWSAQI